MTPKPIPNNISDILLDANIIFDFETAQLIGSLLLGGPHNYHVTDFVYSELKSLSREMLRKFGVNVQELNSSQVMRIKQIAQTNAELSIADISCIIVALDLHIPIATRDRKLREVARENGISMVFDTADIIVALIQNGSIDIKTAVSALKHLNNSFNHPNRSWGIFIKELEKKLQSDI